MKNLSLDRLPRAVIQGGGVLAALTIFVQIGFCQEKFSPYRLGPEDTLTIRVLEVEDISNQAMRIDKSGFLDLPLAGRVNAAGLTVPELEAVIAVRMRKFVHDPRVSVHVSEYRSQPVSVIGAVNTPGVHQLQGPKRVIEILSMAGGLRSDAGPVLQITRMKTFGPLPLPGAQTDASGEYTTAEVDLDRLFKGKTPADNILVLPQDVVSVLKADIIYVVGEVRKAGGFPLKSREKLTILQAISLAEGMDLRANKKKVTILRTPPAGGERTQIAVDMSKVLANEAPDLVLQADDIVVVPNNAPRSVALRAAETALQIGTGVVIFRR